jgi:hypothetical protein
MRPVQLIQPVWLGGVPVEVRGFDEALVVGRSRLDKDDVRGKLFTVVNPDQIPHHDVLQRK